MKNYALKLFYKLCKQCTIDLQPCLKLYYNIRYVSMDPIGRDSVLFKNLFDINFSLTK